MRHTVESVSTRRIRWCQSPLHCADSVARKLATVNTSPFDPPAFLPRVTCLVLVIQNPLIEKPFGVFRIELLFLSFSQDNDFYYWTKSLNNFGETISVSASTLVHLVSQREIWVHILILEKWLFRLCMSHPCQLFGVICLCI